MNRSSIWLVCAALMAPAAVFAACGTSPVAIQLDPVAGTIDVPEPICVNTTGFAATVEWQLPSGYEFEASPSCVVVDNKKLGAGHLPPSANGRVCQVVLTEAWYVFWTLEWKYTLNFKSVGLSSRRWRCDPTIVNTDVGGIMSTVTFNCSIT
jgi:hypothetical protein